MAENLAWWIQRGAIFGSTKWFGVDLKTYTVKSKIFAGSTISKLLVNRTRTTFGYELKDGSFTRWFPTFAAACDYSVELIEAEMKEVEARQNTLVQKRGLILSQKAVDFHIQEEMERKNQSYYRLKILQSWFSSNTQLYQQQNCNWCIVALGNRLNLATMRLTPVDEYYGFNEYRAMKEFSAKFGIAETDVYSLYYGEFPHNCRLTDNPDDYSTDDAINILDALIRKYEAAGATCGTPFA